MFQIRSAPSEHQIRSAARRAPQPVRPHLSGGFASNGASRLAGLVSLLFEADEATLPRLRNFDTKPRSSHCYEVRSDNRLESVANAHTAADLHIRPVSQTALVSRAVGAANVFRNTRCTASRNQFDSRFGATPHASCGAVIVILESKFLNQRAESRASGAVTNLGMAAKIFNKIFTIDHRESGFSRRLPSLWR